MTQKFSVSALLIGLLAFAGEVWAGSITTTVIPGTQSQAGVAFHNTGTDYLFYSFGMNGDGTGYIADSTGFQWNLNCGTNLQCGISAFDPATSWFAGGYLDENFNSIGFVGQSGAVLATFPNLFVSSISGGNFAGTDGRSIHGSLSNLVATGSYSVIPWTNTSLATTIKGNVICGEHTTGSVTGIAYCTVNGVPVPLDAGSDSTIRGYDPFTGLAYGRRDGCAATWSVSTGAYNTFSREDGGAGCQGGVVTSLIPGIATIQNGTQEYTVAGGIIRTNADYNAMLTLATLQNVVFAGDGVTAARIGNNSAEFGVAPTGVWVTGEADPAPGPIPEPGTLTLMIVGSCLIAAGRKHFGKA